MNDHRSLREGAIKKEWGFFLACLNRHASTNQSVHSAGRSITTTCSLLEFPAQTDENEVGNPDIWGQDGGSWIGSPFPTITFYQGSAPRF